MKPVLVLESPKSVHELREFATLAAAFSLELRVSIEGDIRAVKAMEHSRKLPVRAKLYQKTVHALHGLNPYALSPAGTASLSEIPTGVPFALVFGNEENDLKPETLRACTATIKLPAGTMRASQAAAYALGVFSRA